MGAEVQAIEEKSQLFTEIINAQSTHINNMKI